MQWFGPAIVAGALVVYLILWRSWRARWSHGLTRGQRLRVGCIGCFVTMAVFVTAIPAAAWVARGPGQVLAAGVAAVPVGAAWLFFGNVALRAMLSRNTR